MTNKCDNCGDCNKLICECGNLDILTKVENNLKKIAMYHCNVDNKVSAVTPVYSVADVLEVLNKLK